MPAVKTLEGKPADKSSGELAKGNNCPSCGQAIKPGAVICLNCGFNVASGAKIKTNIDGEGDGTGKIKGLSSRFKGLLNSRKGMPQRPSKETASAQAKAKVIDLYIPIGVMIVGVAISFGQNYFAAAQNPFFQMIAKRFTTAGNPLLLAGGFVGSQLVITGFLLFLPLLISLKLFKVDIGPIPLFILKLYAIAFGPGVVGGLVMILVGGGLIGALMAVVTAVSVFLGLLIVLFSLGIAGIGKAILITITAIVLLIIEWFTLFFLLFALLPIILHMI